MSTEREIVMFQKSTVYDLIEIISEKPDTTYTAEEIIALMRAYIKGLEQS